MPEVSGFIALKNDFVGWGAPKFGRMCDPYADKRPCLLKCKVLFADWKYLRFVDSTQIDRHLCWRPGEWTENWRDWPAWSASSPSWHSCCPISCFLIPANQSARSNPQRNLSQRRPMGNVLTPANQDAALNSHVMNYLTGTKALREQSRKWKSQSGAELGTKNSR